MKYGVSAALEELPVSQPVTLRGSIETVCARAAEIGYDAIELHIYEPQRYDAEKLRGVAESHGLRVCAVANGMEYTRGGLSLIDGDPARREAAVRRLLEHCDFAAALGAKLVVGIMRGNIPPDGDRAEYHARFGEALRRVCARAAEQNTQVVLEAILRYINNYLNTARETLDYIRSLGFGNLSLHLDTHSMAMEEINLRESVLACKGGLLGYVHYSDNNRRYPGGGAVDFKAVTRALLQLGYEGYISLECLPWPDAETSAQRGLDYMKAVERAARLELASE